MTSVSARSKSGRDGVESEGWLRRIRRYAGGVKRCDNREDGETRDPWTWAKCAMSRVRAVRPLTLSRTISQTSLTADLLLRLVTGNRLRSPWALATPGGWHSERDLPEPSSAQGAVPDAL